MVCRAETLTEELSFEKLLKKEDQGMQVPHYHNAYEIYYLQDGSRGYDFKDKTLKVKKGNLILIKKHVKHQTFITESQYFNRFLIKFKESSLGSFNQQKNDLLSSFNKDFYHIPLEVEARIMVESILAQMNKEAEKNSYARDIYLRTLLIELLIFINRYLKNKDIDKKESKYHLKIVKIMNYIEENYQLDLSLNKLADQFSYSSSYLSTLFKEKTDHTITEYINNIRIKEAQNLLLGRKDNISTISEKVGYNNLVHFDRNFKARTGLTPSEYRKCYR